LHYGCHDILIKGYLLIYLLTYLLTYQVQEEEEEEEAEKEVEELEEEDEEIVEYREPVRNEDGWSYLHLVTWTYVRLKAIGLEEMARLLIRAIYRLALAGIDVNARDTRGRTALVLAAAESADEAGNIDQSLLTHLLRVGQYERSICQSVGVS